MITEKIVCDLCSKELTHNGCLPYRYSTDSLKHTTRTAFMTNPAIIISSESYQHYCSGCMYNLIKIIAKEQKWCD